MSKLKLFFLSLTITTVGFLIYYYVTRPRPVGVSEPALVQVADDLYITSQLRPEQLEALERRGIKSVLDVRPDAEEAGQPTHGEMDTAASQQGLTFRYIPVPHEGVPEAAVAQLAAELKQIQRPVCLYCRTGRRAVRLYALAEASRTDGPTLDALMQTAAKTGFPVDDFKPELSLRISQRASPTSSPTHGNQ